MTTDFETYWERCFRELGASAMEPKLVAKWCFEQTIASAHRQSPRCNDGAPHSWSMIATNPGHARCVFCKLVVEI